MTSDAGTGGALGPLLGGLFGAAGSAAAAVGAQADMATELSSFTNFQKRVDDLIRDLKGSQAGPAKVGQEQLVRHQFGGGGGAWSEATGLYSAYESVISELETLSKLLSDSMEGMAIAVMASHKGYQNIDLDIRDRMAAISAETSKHYGGNYDPALPQKSHDGGGQGGTGGHDHAAQPSTGDTGGTI